ncbi:MAG: YbbR-like domain-containing protein [Dysgonomonas sp.]
MTEKEFHNILDKARIVWKKTPWKKILVFSFCVLLSAMFWFLQIYNQNFNSTFNIPVKYTSIPENVIFENELPNVLRVTIKDNGYTMFKYFFTKRKDTISIDVADVIKHLPGKNLQGSSLEQIIRSELFTSSELIGYSPGNILFYHTTLEKKKIPVIFDGQIFLASGYLLNGDISVTPDSVMAYGSKDVLNKLDYAYTVNDTANNFSSKDPLIYDIRKIHNVKFTPNKINVTVPIDKYTQKDVVVPITCHNLPDDLTVKFFPSTVKISFLIGLSKYASVTENDFSVEFDYNELKDLKEPNISLRITSTPDHVQNLVISPTEVEFIFEQK